MSDQFTDPELAYLETQRLGRLATVGPEHAPHVVPVGYRLDTTAGTIGIGGHEFGRTKKYRDAERNPAVAFVVDDLASIDPWRPRGVEIRGRADTNRTGGEHLGNGFDDAWIEITPNRIISWGLAHSPTD